MFPSISGGRQRQVVGVEPCHKRPPGGRLGALSIPTVPEWMWLRGATEEDHSIALHQFSRGWFLKKTVAFIYMLPPGGKTPFVASARKAVGSSIKQQRESKGIGV